MSAPCEVRYSARYSARPSGAEIDRRPQTVEIDRRPETVEAPTAAPPQRGGLPSETPYPTVTGLLEDSSNHRSTTDRARARCGHHHARRRRPMTSTAKQTSNAFAIVRAFILSNGDVVNAYIVGNERGDHHLHSLAVIDSDDTSGRCYVAPFTSRHSRELIAACDLGDLA